VSIPEERGACRKEPAVCLLTERLELIPGPGVVLMRSLVSGAILGAIGISDAPDVDEELAIFVY
jgi:uncharacterized protein GlcG (DUF336 family)